MASWSGRRWWAAEIPLRPSQVRLLSLTPVTGMRVTDLAARVGVTVDERDRRVRLVRPTAAGRRLQRQVESAIGELERRWAQEVGPERWATFRDVLAQVGDPATGRP